MKNFLLLIVVLGLFSCKKDDETTPVGGGSGLPRIDNGSDTTVNVPVRVINKITCWVDGVYFESINNSSTTVTNDTIRLACFISQDIPTNRPYRGFFIDIKLGALGDIELVDDLNKKYFTYSERQVGAGANSLFTPNNLNVYVYKNSGGKLEATFWGFVKNFSNDATYKIQSGKIAFDNL